MAKPDTKERARYLKIKAADDQLWTMLRTCQKRLRELRDGADLQGPHDVVLLQLACAAVVGTLAMRDYEAEYPST